MVFNGCVCVSFFLLFFRDVSSEWLDCRDELKSQIWMSSIREPIKVLSNERSTSCTRLLLGCAQMHQVSPWLSCELHPFPCSVDSVAPVSPGHHDYSSLPDINHTVCTGQFPFWLRISCCFKTSYALLYDYRCEKLGKKWWWTSSPVASGPLNRERHNTMKS